MWLPGVRVEARRDISPTVAGIMLVLASLYSRVIQWGISEKRLRKSWYVFTCILSVFRVVRTSSALIRKLDKV